MLFQSQNNITDLSYWLSTTSTLVFLLQNTIKASNAPNATSHRNRTSPTTLFGRMAQVSSFRQTFNCYKHDQKNNNANHTISGFSLINNGHRNFQWVQWNGGKADDKIKNRG